MDRHKRLISAYYNQGSKIKTDLDLLREHYQFLLDDDYEESADGGKDEWQRRMVQNYHAKLYKEYCLADMSRIREPGSPIGMRWRSERELIDGKGQFSCGSLSCTNSTDLTSWEVNFNYVEHGVKKQALVKLRLCPECSLLLPHRIKSHKSHDLLP